MKGKCIHLVRRDLVNKLKSAGGVGIRFSDLLNDSLLFKQTMRLHNDHSLLVSCVIFSPHGCCICKKGLQRCLKGSCSMCKKGLYKALSIFEHDLAWKIEDGKRVLATSMTWWREGSL